MKVLASYFQKSKAEAERIFGEAVRVYIPHGRIRGLPAGDYWTGMPVAVELNLRPGRVLKDYRK